MNKLLSIVIPVYNQELYLDISIPAALGQSYKNLEIVIVNDGSTDSSKFIIEKYQKADNRIKVIDKDNGGLADAVLAGIQNATGEYICFLDSDDRIGNDYVENFMDNIDDCDFIAAGFYCETSYDTMPVRLTEDRVYDSIEIEYNRNHFLIDEKKSGVSRQFYISRWNKLYRTEIVRKIVEGYRKCKNVSLGEDTLFTYLILCNTQKAKTISKPNSYYYNRKSQTSMMSTGKVDQHLDKSFYAADVFRELLASNKDDSEQALALLFYLVEALVQRLQASSDSVEDFCYLFNKLKSNKQYNNAVRVATRHSSLKVKITFILRRIITPKQYLFLRRI